MSILVSDFSVPFELTSSLLQCDQGLKWVYQGSGFLRPYPYHDIPYPWQVWVVNNPKFTQYSTKITVSPIPVGFIAKYTN